MNDKETTEGYVEITIPGHASDKEETVYEVSLEDEVPEIEQEGTEETEAPVEKQELKEKVKQPTRNPDKPSRAAERIKQLNRDKNQYKELLEKERELRMEAERRLNAGSKSNNEVLKQRLEESISMLTAALTESMKNGDAEAAVKAQDLLIEAKMEYAKIKDAIQKHVDVPERTVQRTQEIPEKALEWIDSYPQFRTDRLFNAASIAVNNDLIAAGWDVDSDEFYEEITRRLAPRFPEIFGVKRKSVVSSKEDRVEYDYTDSSEDDNDGEDTEEEDVKKASSMQSKPQNKQVKEQTVSPSSRAPAAVVKKAKNLQKVQLTEQDVLQANRFGMSLEQYAKRKQHSEKNTSEDGYTPIMIER